MAVVRARSARQVGRYQLVYELGQAYLGPLWAARTESEGGSDAEAQLYILRLLSLSGLNADTRVRLLEAAWQAMEVRHPNVAAVTDVVASDGELGVVSSFTEGLPLRSLQGVASVRKMPVPPGVALRIVADLTAGAVCLRDATIELGSDAVPMHGGLSADCVFVGADGACRIGDVGVATVAGSIAALREHADRAAYSAPEQLATPPLADSRTDVFALGVLAWELLSGRRLFLGSGAALSQKVLAWKIPGLKEVKRRGDPDLPEEIVRAVARALERAPEARFQSAAELADVLSANADAFASREAVAAYVGDVAESTLARLKDGLREGPSPLRTAAPAREVHPARPAAAAPKEDLGKTRPAPPPRKDLLAATRPADAALPGQKPELPQRGPPPPRKRQPTMMGVAPPAPLSAPTAPAPLNHAMGRPDAETELDLPLQEERLDEPLTDSERGLALPDSLDDTVLASVPPPGYGDESTAQYDAAHLLSQFEKMEEAPRFQVATARKSSFPPPGDAPERAAPPASPPASGPPLTPPLANGGWLDDPAPAAPSVAPRPRGLPETSSHVPAARRTAPLPVAPRPSSPPQSFLPSQAPPPLMHDPRASRATKRPAPARPAPRSTPRRSEILLAIGVSAGLVITSGAVAALALRALAPQEETERPEAPRVEAAPEPAPPPPEPAPPPPEPAPPPPEPAAPPPEPAAVPSVPPTYEAAAAPTAAAVVPAPLREQKAAPPPLKPAPRKKKRFVPSDI